MQSETVIPTRLMILIALLQGFILLLLHQAVDFKFWPYDQPTWLVCFYALTLSGPTMFLLSCDEATKLRNLSIWILLFSVLTASLGAYVGSQIIPLDSISYPSLLAIFYLTLFVASFIGLLYIQGIVSGEFWNYEMYVNQSWRNFLTLVLALAFAACFWGILMLWAQLFKAIEISFFYDLFTERWFYYPLIALAYGFGIVILRYRSNLIDKIKSLQEILIKFLLVILTFISIIFLITLLFQGLYPLWQNGGSLLILWLQILLLFFTNSVYQDGSGKQSYNIWVHRFIYTGLALLPVYSLVTLYGLNLRIDQYGWSIMRCWAHVIWFLLTLFSIAYFYLIVRFRDSWSDHLGKVNIITGCVVFIAMIVVNTPLLDFRKITVKSQLLKLEQSEISLDQFDARYFRYQLARPGFEALRYLKEKYKESEPIFVNKLEQLNNPRTGTQLHLTETQIFSLFDEHSSVPPPQLKSTFYQFAQDNNWKFTDIKKIFVISLDLNKNDEQEYLFILRSDYSADPYLFSFDGSKWIKNDLVLSGRDIISEDDLGDLKQGDFDIIDPEWNIIKLKGNTIQVIQAE